MASSTPWNIYAEQLFPVGYGYPLWFPEPCEGYEVSIGDVGYLKEGRFWALFNSMHEETDDENNSRRNRRVPVDYQKFNATKNIIRTEDKILQRMVCSRSICNVEAQGDIGGGGVAVNAGVGFKFQSTSDGGAFTVLSPPGYSEDIHSTRYITNYMKDNIESWMELATSLDKGFGLDLKEHHLIFVCGTTKTTQWGVAAFQNNVYREKSGYVSTSFGSSATAEFSINISNQSLPTSHYRYGPIRERNVPMTPMIQLPEYDRPDAAAAKRDQCIFIHYFKMKRRLWFFKEPMYAGAGPHQLPPSGPQNPGTDVAIADAGSPTYELEPERYPTQEETYDPVNDLLDYILQVSRAEIAVASDLDIIAIFKNKDFPQDIPEALIRVAPRIRVDKHGVGTVSISYDMYDIRDRLDDFDDIGFRVSVQFVRDGHDDNPLNDDDYWAKHGLSMEHRYSTAAQIDEQSASSTVWPDDSDVDPYLPIRPYIGKPFATSASGPSRVVQVLFRTVDGRKLPLLDALHERFEALAKKDEPALPRIGAIKAFIRIKVEGCDTSYTGQIVVRRPTNRYRPISSGDLAHKIAQKIEAFLTKAREEGAPLQYGGKDVAMDDLLLDSFIQSQYSHGSWYPVLRIHRQSA